MGYKFIHRLKLEFAVDNKMLGKILYAVAHCLVAPEFSKNIQYQINRMRKMNCLEMPLKIQFEKQKF